MPSAHSIMTRMEKKHQSEMNRQYKGANTLRELFERHNITDGLAQDFTVDTWTKTDQNKFRTAMSQIGYKDTIFLYRIYKLPFQN